MVFARPVPQDMRLEMVSYAQNVGMINLLMVNIAPIVMHHAPRATELVHVLHALMDTICLPSRTDN